MKVFLGIVLAVVVVAFVAIALWGGSGQTPPQNVDLNQLEGPVRRNEGLELDVNPDDSDVKHSQTNPENEKSDLISTDSQESQVSESGPEKTGLRVVNVTSLYGKIYKALSVGAEVYVGTVVSRSRLAIQDDPIEAGRLQFGVTTSILGTRRKTLSLPYSFAMRPVKSDYYSVWPNLDST